MTENVLFAPELSQRGVGGQPPGDNESIVNPAKITELASFTVSARSRPVLPPVVEFADVLTTAMATQYPRPALYAPMRPTVLIANMS